jgi:hypothetical protein
MKEGRRVRRGASEGGAWEQGVSSRRLAEGPALTFYGRGERMFNGINITSLLKFLGTIGLPMAGDSAGFA